MTGDRRCHDRGLHMIIRALPGVREFVQPRAAVLASGAFDPLHYGHIRYIQAAAEQARAENPPLVRCRNALSVLSPFSDRVGISPQGEVYLPQATRRNSCIHRPWICPRLFSCTLPQNPWCSSSDSQHVCEGETKDGQTPKMG